MIRLSSRVLQDAEGIDAKLQQIAVGRLLAFGKEIWQPHRSRLDNSTWSPAECDRAIRPLIVQPPGNWARSCAQSRQISTISLSGGPGGSGMIAFQRMGWAIFLAAVAATCYTARAQEQPAVGSEPVSYQDVVK